MFKLLCNVLKILGRANAPPGCAPDYMYANWAPWFSKLRHIYNNSFE